MHKENKNKKQAAMHTSCPQDMLLSWTCRNVFDPKPCLFFPTILVSLIKETTSVHKFCFSGGFHYNICCHKPLGIHRSLSLCLSLSQTQMKSYPTIRLSLCAKSGVVVSRVAIRWADRLVQHSAVLVGDVALHPKAMQTAELSAALVQLHQCQSWRDLSQCSLLLHFKPQTCLKPLVRLQFLRCMVTLEKHNLYSRAGENHQMICYKLFTML